MKKSFSIILTACFALFSCAKQEPQINGTDQPTGGEPETPAVEYLDEITVAAPGTGLPVRTVTNDGVKVLWTNNDQIGLFVGTSSEQRTQCAIYTTSLASPSATATFGRVEDPEPAMALGKYFAIYPARSFVKWGSFGNTASSKRCYFNLPAEQTAVKGGWDSRAAVMTASSETKEFAFKHVVAYVSFEVTSSTPSFVQVTVSSVSGETLSDSNANINYLDNGSITVNQHGAASEKSSSVTLSNSDDSAFAPGKYYVAFMPGTFASGLNLTFVNGEGQSAVIAIEGPLVVEPGDVLAKESLADLKFVSAVELPQLYDKNGVKGVAFWADPVNPSKVKIISGPVINTAWASADITIKTDIPVAEMTGEDCGANAELIASLEKYSETNFPAVYFCRSMGEGWRLPSANELLNLLKVYYNDPGTFDKEDYLVDTDAQAAAAVFNELLAQCVTNSSETTYDETKINLGSTSTMYYWTGQGDLSAGADDPKIKRVTIQKKPAAGATRSIIPDSNTSKYYVRCVRDVELK